MSFLFAHNSADGGRTKTHTHIHMHTRAVKLYEEENSVIMFTNIVIAIYYALDSVEQMLISIGFNFFSLSHKIHHIYCYVLLTSN